MINQTALHMCDSIINSKLKNEKGPWALNTHLVYVAFNLLDHLLIQPISTHFKKNGLKLPPLYKI